ncbi:LysR family transcriptional regulator [Frankia sp. Cppng1_Ct_nod]|uniref:LysR family transcriptional regulator n=1 Tax=Frankia sp. Cppng1_Ct_nod TaxID=2897162 RepID=UPI0013EFBF13|nr:LysR family transcriptional regulator [Frankia sp. Cppng1_Ct_nod]
MDIQQLRCFVAVAEELHFGRAADRLHLTASPLSRRIRELERELGEELFVRGYHQVTLTRCGRELLEPAADVVRRFDALGARRPDRTARSTREIGAAPLLTPTIVDLVLGTFKQLYPDIELPITLERSAVLMEMLCARELDLAVVHLPVTDPGLRGLELARYRYAVATRSDDDELASRPRVRLADLIEREMLLPSSKLQPLAMKNLRDFLVRAGIRHLNELPHADSIHLAARVIRTRSITLVVADPDNPSTRSFAGPGFALVPLDEPDLHFAAGVAWRADDESADPILAHVMETLRTGRGATLLVV